MDVFACQCEEVTRAELIGLRPPRYLDWESEQMSCLGLGRFADIEPGWREERGWTAAPAR